MSGGVPERLSVVEARIEAACRRAGRRREEVSIVACTRSVGPDEVRALAEAGVTVVGEERVREAAEKIERCPGSLDWHMVGRLKRGAVPAAVRLFDMIHLVDSWELLECINGCCGEAGRQVAVCLAVDVVPDGGGLGLDPSEVPAVLEQAGHLMNVEMAGLGAAPPFRREKEEMRPFFRRLRELLEQCRAGFGMELRDLSMGTSADFEVAVEEGATWLRLREPLVGGRKASQGEVEA